MRATVTDRRLQVVSSGNIEDFRTEVEQCDDYAFGAKMPGRNLDPDEYRFGYNGKEDDIEMKGEVFVNGNSTGIKVFSGTIENEDGSKETIHKSNGEWKSKSYSKKEEEYQNKDKK